MAPIVLITGGTRGLGLEAAQQLVEQYHVIITSRTLAAAEAAAKQLGHGAQGLELDVSSDASLAALGAAAAKLLDGKRIDVLVNNAAVWRNSWNQASYDEIVKANVAGPVQVIKALLPYLNDKAQIVNLTSTLGHFDLVKDDQYQAAITGATSIEQLLAIPFNADAPAKDSMFKEYSVSKAMLSRATEILAADPELQAKHISVVAVCPGWCRTDMGSGANEGAVPPRSALEGGISIATPIKHFKPELNGKSINHRGDVFGEHLTQYDWESMKPLPAGTVVA